MDRGALSANAFGSSDEGDEPRVSSPSETPPLQPEPQPEPQSKQQGTNNNHYDSSHTNASFGGISSVQVTPSVSSSGMIKFGITTYARTDDPNAQSRGGVSTFAVVRSLDDFHWYKQQFFSKEPFSFLGTLPIDETKGFSTTDALPHLCHQLLTFLTMLVVSSKTHEDPLLWSLLTTPEEEFDRQVKDDTVKQWKFTITAETIRKVFRGFGETPSTLSISLPKPQKVSKEMLDTTVADRAFLVADKISKCLQTAQSFQKLYRASCSDSFFTETREAVGKALELQKSAYNLQQAYIESAEGFRGITSVHTWPWATAKKGDTGAGSSVQQNPSSSEGTANEGAVATTVKSASQRLGLYLQRMAVNWIESGRNEALIMDDQFFQTVSALFYKAAALESSLIFSHATLCHSDYAHLESRIPLLNHRTTHILEHGTGFDELLVLDKIEQEVSEIQDTINEAVNSFVSHRKDVETTMNQRFHLALKEHVTQQIVTWEATSLLLRDLQRSLEEDEFLDVEPLQFDRYDFQPTAVRATPADAPEPSHATAKDTSNSQKDSSAAGAAVGSSVTATSSEGSGIVSTLGKMWSFMTGGSGTSSPDKSSPGSKHRKPPEAFSNENIVPQPHSPAQKLWSSDDPIAQQHPFDFGRPKIPVAAYEEMSEVPKKWPQPKHRVSSMEQEHEEGPVDPFA